MKRASRIPSIRPSDFILARCWEVAEALRPLILIVQGGLNGWKAAGYPVITDRRQPLPLMRQVQIVAGALVFGGTLAGASLSALFYLIPAFVGAGLLFAGLTGWCGMAKLLAVMPWNKRAGEGLG